MRKKRTGPQTYREFLSQQRRLAVAADRVLESTAELGHLRSRDDFAAEVERRRAGQAGAAERPRTLAAVLGRQPQQALDDRAVGNLALVCRAAEVALGHPPWHHQIVAALLLYRGVVLEMPNGTGKTLCAALAAGLNAVAGKRTHVATHNDYLAERDTRWMGRLYTLLGLTAGVLFSSQSVACEHGILSPDGALLRVAPKPGAPWPAPAPAAAGPASSAGGEADDDEPPGDGGALPPRPAGAAPDQLAHETLADYEVDAALTAAAVLACDVVYGRIESFGFAYLRDHQVLAPAERVLEHRHLLIVDECDAILLDDLRTPLILSKNDYTFEPGRTAQALRGFDWLARQLEPGVDVRVAGETVELTYAGLARIEQLTGEDFYRPERCGLAHGLFRALEARHVYRRDVHYLVDDLEIRLIDRASGRLLGDRRFGDGLHEAIEVKEGLGPRGQHGATLPLGRITIKHFARTYETVSGMSGAIGQPDEYRQFYGIEPLAVSPFPQSREDLPDLVFLTKDLARRGILDAAVQAVEESGQPVLINVPSLAELDALAALFRRAGVPFQVLDPRRARNLTEEADRVRAAAEPGTITICSKLAARGTDIVLGPDALAAGGLFVIGRERGFDRRHDDQLRGRAGRKGDPGRSLFVISLEDDLMVAFGSHRVANVLKRLGEEDEAVTHPMITTAIRRAQRTRALHDFLSRRQVVEFDDILARHRLIFYDLRQKVLLKEDLRPEVLAVADNWAAQKAAVLKALPSPLSRADLDGVVRRVGQHFEAVEIERVLQVHHRHRQARLLGETLRRKVAAALAAAEATPDLLRLLFLTTLDEHWTKYLRFEDALQEELRLYLMDLKRALAHYSVRMEERFDTLFLEVGEDLLARLLALPPAVRAPAAPDAPDAIDATDANDVAREAAEPLDEAV